jgi:protein-tyrosine phosphatase
MPFDKQRHIPLQGAFNLRDVGGLAAADGAWVRRGVLFRSDALARLTDADLRALERLGLRTIVDLRTAQERASAPDRLPPGNGIKCVHLAMRDPSMPDSRLRMMAELVYRGRSMDFDALLQRHYMAFAFQCTQSMGALVHLLADASSFPALVHCTAGKDRTGFTMAVLLLSLGVSSRDVMADHLATNELLQPSIPGYVRTLRWLSLGRLGAQQVMPLLEARAEHLEQVVGEICGRHGSVQGWLEAHCGVRRDTHQRLADLLLTGP